MQQRNTEYSFPDMDKKSYTPIYIQISEILIDYAQQNGLTAGDLLPSENELLAQYDVSRNTIRLAVERLVKMNFAVKKRGKGTFVKQSWPVNLNPIMTLENSVKLAGQSLENQLVSMAPARAKDLAWTRNLSPMESRELMLIKRLKTASGKILALEDRLLPAHICQRYPEDELKTQNICPDLLDRHPDTVFASMAYHFISRPLGREEQIIVGQNTPEPVLQRIGEYFDDAGRCFLYSRYAFVSDLVDVCYRYERNDNQFTLIG